MESTGQAKAEAQSRAEAARIQGEAAVQQAKLKAEATKIEAVGMSVANYLTLAPHTRKLLSSLRTKGTLKAVQSIASKSLSAESLAIFPSNCNDYTTLLRGNL